MWIALAPAINVKDERLEIIRFSIIIFKCLVISNAKLD